MIEEKLTFQRKMKKHKLPNIPISTIIITLLSCAVIFLWLWKEDEAISNKQKDNIIAEKNAVIEYKTNENGDLVAEKTAALASRDAIKNAYNAEVGRIRKNFDVKLKDMQSFITAKIETIGEGKSSARDTLIIKKDGIEITGKKIRINEEWVSLTGILLNNDFEYRYSTRDSVTFVTSFKRDKFLGPKKLIVNGISHNPNSNIAGLRNIVVDDFKPKRFSLGPALFYDPFDNQFRVGVSVNYSVIKF